jgi:rare lipoprotein A
MKTKIYIYLLFLILVISSASCRTARSRVVTETGKASFYHDKFAGRKTASGERYNRNKLTAAHKTLPFGTMVKVTNLTNGRTVIVKVNDRGPFAKGRIIDLSKKAAHKVGMIDAGVANVKIEYTRAR